MHQLWRIMVPMSRSIAKSSSVWKTLQSFIVKTITVPRDNIIIFCQYWWFIDLLNMFSYDILYLNKIHFPVFGGSNMIASTIPLIDCKHSKKLVVKLVKLKSGKEKSRNKHPRQRVISSVVLITWGCMICWVIKLSNIHWWYVIIITVAI